MSRFGSLSQLVAAGRQQTVRPASSTTGGVGVSRLGILNPFSIAATAGFGLLNFFGQRSANRAIRRAAEQNQKFINQAITRTRVKSRIDQAAVSRRGTRFIAGEGLRARRSGPSVSVDRALSQLQGDLTESVDNLETQFDDAVSILEREKLDIVNQANSAQRSPLLAAISGAAGGARLGVGLTDLLNQRRELELLDAAARATGNTRLAIGGIRLAMAATEFSLLGEQQAHKSRIVRDYNERLGSLSARVNAILQRQQGGSP